MDDVEYCRAEMRRALEMSGLSVNAWAKKAGVSESGVRGFINGDAPNISVSYLAKLARVIERPIATFFEGGMGMNFLQEERPQSVTTPSSEVLTETPPPPSCLTLDAICYVPVFDLALSAGHGAWCENDPQPAYVEPFNAHWLRRLTRTGPEHLILACVSGDSMDPTLHDGDQILVDTSARRISRDGIYGLRQGEDLLVKRITVDPRSGKFTISSDNPHYVSYGDVSGDEVRIIGRVIWLGRRV